MIFRRSAKPHPEPPAADPLSATPEGRYPPTGPILDVDGTRVHAHVEGQGRTVILIHGASGNIRDYTFALVDRLKHRYRVIAFDRPGLGHTDALHEDGETPFEQAALLDAAAELLGVRRAVIVGHSYGAAVALAWALQHPKRVAAVVSLAGAVNPWEGDLGAWYQITSSWIGGLVFVPLVSAFAPRSQTDYVLTSIFEPQPVPEGYADHVGIDLTLRAGTIRANARQVNGLKPHVTEMATRYGEIRVPVEIVHGTEDTIVPIDVHSRPLIRQIATARLTELAGVGHMPHHADPEATLAAIDRAAKRARLR